MRRTRSLGSWRCVASCVSGTVSQRAIYTFLESGEFHPYSISLTRLLQDHCQGSVVVVDTAGVSGERVIPSMTRRLDRLLRETSDPYDWVLVLGGTNDLGTGTRADELLPHLLGDWVSTTEQGRKGPPKHSPSPSHSLCTSWERETGTTGKRRLR